MRLLKSLIQKLNNCTIHRVCINFLTTLSYSKAKKYLIFPKCVCCITLFGHLDIKKTPKVLLIHDVKTHSPAKI